jgi:hypothetical protein
MSAAPSPGVTSRFKLSTSAAARPGSTSKLSGSAATAPIVAATFPGRLGSELATTSAARALLPWLPRRRSFKMSSDSWMPAGIELTRMQ